LGLLLLVASGDAARVEEVKLRPATAGEDPNTSVDATTVMPVDGEKGSIRRAKKKPAKKTIDNDDDDVSSEEKDQDEAGGDFYQDFPLQLFSIIFSYFITLKILNFI
jgi:hypothetical protein